MLYNTNTTAQHRFPHILALEQQHFKKNCTATSFNKLHVHLYNIHHVYFSYCWCSCCELLCWYTWIFVVKEIVDVTFSAHNIKANGIV